MSSFANQRVLRMPPLGTRALVQVGESLLQQVCPAALERPTALPVLNLFEETLPRFGIHTYPVCDAELPDEEAVTDPDGKVGDEITIRVREEFFDSLLYGGPRAYRARATLTHELGHAVLHVNVIRRRIEHGPVGASLLQRQRMGDIPTYEQSEWQAWMLGGTVLMPLSTLKMLGSTDERVISETYEVSRAMARAHLGRLRRGGLL